MLAASELDPKGFGAPVGVGAGNGGIRETAGGEQVLLKASSATKGHYGSI